MKEENSIKNKDDERQNQLLEIYKIQIQSSDDISNRRATLARYYIVVMSALIFGTFKVLEDFNKIEGDFLKEIGPDKIAMGRGIQMNKIARYLINSKVSRWSDLISDWGYIIILIFLILTVFILGRLGCGVSEIDSHSTQEQEKMEIKESNQTDHTLNPKKFDIYQSIGYLPFRVVLISLNRILLQKR